MRLGVGRRLRGGGACARRARGAHRAAEFSHGATRNLLDARGPGRARGLPHAGRRAGFAALARRAARRLLAWARRRARVRPVPRAARRDADDRARARVVLRSVRRRAGRPPLRSRARGRAARSCSARAASSRMPTARSLRGAWERVPFRDVPYAEDQQLAVDMLRAGYAKVFVAGAAVEHSHEYAPRAAGAALLRRVARAARGLRLRRAAGAARRCATACSRPRRPTCAGRARAATRTPRRSSRGRRWPRARRCTTPRARPARRSARATTGCPRACAARCRSSRARPSRRSPATNGDPAMTARPARSARPCRTTEASAGRRDRRDAARPAREPAPPDRADLAVPRPARGAWRIVTFPIRFTPLRHRLKLGTLAEAEQRRAVVVVSREGPPGERRDPDLRRSGLRRRGRAQHPPHDAARAACGSSSPTTRRPAPSTSPRCRRSTASTSSSSARRTSGFAANANRGLRAADPKLDVVLLNADIVARERWLESCSTAPTRATDVGIVGGKLLYPDGRIQHAGVQRNLGAPVWFDHRFRFKPAEPRARRTSPCRARRDGRVHVRQARGARRDRPARRALPDGLRGRRLVPARVAGRLSRPVLPAGDARPPRVGHPRQEVGEREKASQVAFWERWGEFFDGRGATVRTPDGQLRVVYVTEDTGVGGGHRDIFEHLNRMRERGHDVELYTLGRQPDWFDLDAPVHTLRGLRRPRPPRSREEDAIKVATWWNTGTPVWTASVLRGIPVFFVQDIETSYYPDDERNRLAVLAGYRNEFRYMTISGWNADRLRELGLQSTLVPPGIDLDTFRPLPDVKRRDDMLLALGRTNPLKNLPLTIDAWNALPPASGRAVPVRHRAAARRALRHALRRGAERRGGQRPLQRGDGLRPDVARTRASACRRWRRWRPAARSSARTRTATATSASTARTASCPSRPSRR